MGLHNKNFFIFGRMFITMYIYMIILVFVCVLSTRVYGRAHICVRMCVIFFFEVPFTILIFFFSACTCLLSVYFSTPAGLVCEL